jgi:AraC-like DNA-binding protein
VTPLAFFRLPQVERLLARAAKSAGTPLSLHYQAAGQEGTRVEAWGECAACALVNQLPAGARACRESRSAGGAMALEQQRAIPYLCHMGFACITVPVPAAEGFLLTFGPYSPAEASQSLEYDALRGLQAVDGQARTTFPVALDDIHRAPAGAVSGVVEWTTEALTALWRAAHIPEADRPSPTPGSTDPTGSLQPGRNVPSRRRPAPGRLSSANVPAAEVAAALAAGNEGQARELLRGALQETQRTGRRAQAALRARTVAVTAAVLEAAELAGLATASAWAAFPAFVGEAQQAQSDQTLVDAAFGPLGQVRREAKQSPELALAYAPLNAILEARLEEGITLEEVAVLLNENPSTITHRLQRKFGMSFSEYLGRMRINKAKQLLRRTRLTATVVAQRVGVQDQSNFSKLFRRFEGMSPLEYRERFGKNT